MRAWSVRDMLPAAALGLTVIGLIAVVSLRPDNTSLTRTEIYDPHLTLGEIITRVNKTGGLVVGNGAYENIVVVRYTSSAHPPPEGLWLSLKADGLPGCSPATI